MDLIKKILNSKKSLNSSLVPAVKKGQGLSLTVIIVAALALIVLVVLVLIFTGRMAIFTDGLGESGAAELTKYKITYGDCHPTSTQETVFLSDMKQAANDKSNTAELEISAQEDFEDVIDDCRAAGLDENSCEFAGCDWN